MPKEVKGPVVPGPSATGNAFNGLVEGQYTVTATDQNGCEVQQDVLVDRDAPNCHTAATEPAP